tara:strand:+ start:6152 stop:7117 length:966 start_codon:yes stop_codon:yes gene_type:complete
MQLFINKKYFNYNLLHPINTSNSKLTNSEGWLINIKDKTGKEGWGEICNNKFFGNNKCNQFLHEITGEISREKLIKKLIKYNNNRIDFGIFSALYELDGLIGSKINPWLNPPESAILISFKTIINNEINEICKAFKKSKRQFTIKWKVGILPNDEEEILLEKILAILPCNCHLRIDANGSWNKETAKRWCSILKNEPRLDWLEQPLHVDDIEGLNQLSEIIPIALDESLLKYPELNKTWHGWKIRRPSLEGNPSLLIKQLSQNSKYQCISTSFEAGIGGRWINYFAALQYKGEYRAQGLAKNLMPNSNLFSNDPIVAWNSI